MLSWSLRQLEFLTGCFTPRLISCPSTQKKDRGKCSFTVLVSPGRQSVSEQQRYTESNNSLPPPPTTHTHTHTHTHKHVHTHTGTHTSTCTHTQAHTHKHTQTSSHTHKHTHAHTQAHKLTHTQAHTHTSTHTCKCTHTLQHQSVEAGRGRYLFLKKNPKGSKPFLARAILSMLARQAAELSSSSAQTCALPFSF